MFKQIFRSLTIIALILIIACEEEGPYINFTPEIMDTSLIDTSYISSSTVSPQMKNVLIEDFTGVRCPNCPNAALKIHEIDSIYPGRLVPIAIHMFDNNFAYPHIPTVDYRTIEGTNIYNLLGGGALPIGGIDRVKYLSETNVLVRTDKWLTYFVERLSLTPECNIILTSTPHETDSNTYIIKVLIQYTSAISNKNYLTLALTESDMISPQTQPNGKVDSNYIHKHVLRKILTNSSGNLLMENPETNRVFIKEYKLKIDNSWNSTNCSIIGFVHRNDTEFNVIQVAEIKL